MKTKYTIVLAGLSVLLVACGSATEKESTESAPMAMAMKMETIQIQKTNPRVDVKLPGELVADQEVELYAKMPSYVKTLRVDVGSEVKSGDVLMTMEAPEIQSQLAAAHSKLKAQEAVFISVKSTYDRVLRANETEGAISQDAVDQIIAKKESAEAELAAARSKYQEVKAIEEYLVLRAPFSGVITSRSVDTGAFVGPAGKGSHAPLLVLQSNKLLRLSLAIPEANTPYVHLNDTVVFSVKSLPQKVVKGVITRKSGALDAKLRAEYIEVDVPNTDGVLLPRMVVDASIALQSKEATFFIPKSALVDSNMGVYVMRVVDGLTQKVMVRKGRSHGMMVEVFGELIDGDTLLKVVNEETKENISVQ